MTAITGSDFGVGERDVAIAEMGTGVDHTSVSDKNYSVDVASLNERFSNLSVIINRAKPMPNVSFKDKYYDGSSDVEFALASGTGEFDLTTLNYPTYLRNELSKLRIDGNVTYKLSANGKIDDNVATDADGKVIAHNIMVQGLRIVVDGDAKLLNNYEIYGSRYTGNGYSTVGTVTSGVIDDYEMLDAVTVWKTDIKILANNVIIKDKVYDGTRDVDVRILLENSGVVKSQEDSLLPTTCLSQFRASGLWRSTDTNICLTTTCSTSIRTDVPQTSSQGLSPSTPISAKRCTTAALR